MNPLRRIRDSLILLLAVFAALGCLIMYYTEF